MRTTHAFEGAAAISIHNGAPSGREDPSPRADPVPAMRTRDLRLHHVGAVVNDLQMRSGFIASPGDRD